MGIGIYVYKNILFLLFQSSFNEHHLRRSLKTLIEYADKDIDMQSSSFPDQVREDKIVTNNIIIIFYLQVRELAINLHHILLDTVKMQSFQNVSHTQWFLFDLIFSLNLLSFSYLILFSFRYSHRILKCLWISCIGYLKGLYIINIL